MRLHLGAILCLLVTLGGCLAQFPWSFQVEYQKNLTLSCNDTNLPSPAVRYRWMLPNLEIKDAGWQDEKDGLRWVSSDGYMFYITFAQDRDFGIYHCMVEKPAGDYFVVKRGVNLAGPFYGDLWQKYRMSVIIGGSAAGGFLAFMILVCVVYKFRYREPEGQVHEKYDAYAVTVTPANGQLDGVGVAYVSQDDNIEKIPMEQYQSGPTEVATAAVVAKETEGMRPTEVATAAAVVKGAEGMHVYDNPAMKGNTADYYKDKLTEL